MLHIAGGIVLAALFLRLLPVLMAIGTIAMLLLIALTLVGLVVLFAVLDPILFIVLLAATALLFGIAKLQDWRWARPRRRWGRLDPEDAERAWLAHVNRESGRPSVQRQRAAAAQFHGFH